MKEQAMNRITFPLAPQMQGQEVGNLQAALLLVLDRRVVLHDDDQGRSRLNERLAREAAATTYGDATSKVVSIFQESRRLRPTGAVDELTADAFNVLLREWGLLDRPDEPIAREITGRVRRGDGSPVGGAVVKALNSR
jgi:hypothetical protein